VRIVSIDDLGIASPFLNISSYFISAGGASRSIAAAGVICSGYHSPANLNRVTNHLLVA
jgi:hypothetical protein